MKKFIIIMFLFLFLPVVNASTNTYERTSEDYLVPDRITVTSERKSAIMSTPAVNETEKIYDFADLLSEEEEQELFKLVSDYISDTNYDLAIVTIDDNPKSSTMNFADDFYDYNKFGMGETYDGSVIVIDMDYREIYISTTGFAIKMYNDNRIDSIIDAGYNQLKSARYYDCLKNMVHSMSNYFNIGYPSGNSNMQIDKFGNPYYIRKIPYLALVIGSIIVSTIISLILYFKSRLKIKVLDTVKYINPDNTTVNVNSTFVSTHTSRIRIETSSGSSGGGGGGSSFHSGSSGISHGGGGRSF